MKFDPFHFNYNLIFYDNLLKDVRKIINFSNRQKKLFNQFYLHASEA